MAAAALREKIAGQEVQCEEANRDQYGRSVSVCVLPRLLGKSENLNAWMVSNGHAVAYRQYSKMFVDDEDAARAGRKGIWSGSFQVPAEWRKEGKSQTAIKAPSLAQMQPTAQAQQPTAIGGPPPPNPACPIKGNIGSSGTKIYHLPGSAFYDRTVIDTGAGERWFCSAGEAEANGWRGTK